MIGYPFFYEKESIAQKDKDLDKDDKFMIFFFIKNRQSRQPL
jgi:hypothetical protein